VGEGVREGTGVGVTVLVGVALGSTGVSVGSGIGVAAGCTHAAAMVPSSKNSKTVLTIRFISTSID
jgi:hypothetical protein